MMGRGHCKRCGVERAGVTLYNRRGMCNSCYQQERRESTIKYARRSPAADYCGPSRPTTEPTMSPPGSEEKIAVLKARVERCEAVDHAKDGVEFDWRAERPPEPAPPVRVLTLAEMMREFQEDAAWM